MSGTLDQLEKVNQAAKDKAQGREVSEDLTEELPKGAAPLEASAEDETTAEATDETQPEAQEETSEEDLIRIGDQEFKTKEEAVAYAKQLHEEKLINDAYTQGIQTALQAQGKQETPTPEPEDDFEQRFYSDPKKTLKEMQDRAVATAIQQVQAHAQAERMWNEFQEKYPDVRRKDAERILKENWDTIGKVSDIQKGYALLASKVRAEYEEIIERVKPRTELSNKKVQVSGTKGASSPGVTPGKQEKKPLDFLSQVRTLKRG